MFDLCVFPGWIYAQTFISVCIAAVYVGLEMHSIHTLFFVVNVVNGLSPPLEVW